MPQNNSGAFLVIYGTNLGEWAIILMLHTYVPCKKEKLKTREPNLSPVTNCDPLFCRN